MTGPRLVGADSAPALEAPTPAPPQPTRYARIPAAQLPAFSREGAVHKKYWELHDAVRALPVGDGLIWTDPPNGRGASSLVLRWGKHLGMMFETYVVDRVRYVRRVK